MRSRLARRFAAVLPVAFLLLPLPLHAENEPLTVPLETYDQPPGQYKPREDPLARSPGLTVGAGSYVSIQVNVDSVGQNIVGDAANEPSIAVNPTNPANMIVGWRQFDTIASNFRQAGYAYTFDAGQSWTFPGSLTPGIFRSDPVLDFDSQGNAYYQSLLQSFDMSVFKSVDGGMTWSSPVFSFGGDKNWMVVDRSGGIGDGNNYGAWRQGFGCCGNNVITRSTDGAQNFETPVAVPGSPAIGTMAVGPDGAVYVSGVDHSGGTDFNTWVVSKSTNAENPASTPTFTGVEVDLGGGMEIFGGPNPQGLMGQANVVVNQQNGYVFLLASVDPFAPGSNPTDVHLVRSIDGGSTWSDPVRVNDDAPNSGAWHWMAALSVAPNGRLDAFWADSRNGASSSMNEIFYSYSYDQGVTWAPNVAASPQYNSSVGWPQQSKLGDYYTLVSDDTGANAAYAATFNGEQDIYSLRLFPDCNSNGQSDVIDIAHETSEDCNSNLTPDECEASLSCGAAGSTPDGKFVFGDQLVLGKAANGNVDLSWGGSCLGGDNDYEVYEGSLGDFASHAPSLCTTGSQTTAQIQPTASSSYYLVVPRNFIGEGSYGVDGSGAQRPAALAACLPQIVGPCSF
jgi:hypothetical protein